jgi:hypothetical protein
MNCPNCQSSNTTTAAVTESFAYGEIVDAFKATFPAMTCVDCHFNWRDVRAEEAIDAAMQEYLSLNDPEKRVAEFSEKVRELLAEYMQEDFRESYRESLLLLAAEI